MCGIVGAVAQRDVAGILVEGLKIQHIYTLIWRSGKTENSFLYLK